ncbi:MAG: hypothetical protein GXY86_15820 [Firmicutes bacterium]|nr:hypothetical protein [Bacillota bacterium]
MTPEEYTQTVNSYNEYLERMHTAVGHICEDLQESNYQELGLAMPAVVEGLAWVYEAANEFVGLGKIETGQYTLLENLIKNLGEAMENQDFLLLHDLLEFELLPLLEGIKVGEAKIY